MKRHRLLAALAFILGPSLGCDFLVDAFRPVAPTPSSTPTICIADDQALDGVPTNLELRFDGVTAAEAQGAPPGFDSCLGDGEAWDLNTADGSHLWLGLRGAAAGVVENVNAALALDAPLSIRLATNRDPGPGADQLAITLPELGDLPVVAFQRNASPTAADAGALRVADGGGIPVVLSDECGLFEQRNLVFDGDGVDLVDEAGTPDPETGELPVLAVGSAIVFADGGAAVVVNGEIVDVAAHFVFARAAADCPDPPPTGAFVSWTALLRF